MAQLGAALAVDLRRASCANDTATTSYLTEAECAAVSGTWLEGGSESRRDIRDVQYVGIGKSMYHAGLAAITAGSTAAFIEDTSSAHPIWDSWGAQQRDLFVLDRWGRLVYSENLTPGFDGELLRRSILAGKYRQSPPQHDFQGRL